MNLNVAAFTLLLATAATALGQSTPVSSEHRELVHDLLEDSLEHELKLLEQEKGTHWGTREEYIRQIRLRGRVGETAQVQHLIDAILGKHEDRNLERSQRFMANSSRATRISRLQRLAGKT